MSDEFIRKKRWHAKVRSGCLTCRKRRVKCDETKPCCQKCFKTGLACEGSSYGSIASQADPQSLRPCSPGTSEFEQPEASVATSRLIKSTAVQDHPDALQLRSLLHILAGGKLDPFNAFCVESPRQDQYILDYATHSQWSLFAPSQGIKAQAMVKQDILSYAVHHPVSYHALVYAGACHAYFWQKSISRNTERDPELIQLKLRALKTLREAVERSVDHRIDDIMVGTLLLAAHDGGDRAQRRPLGKVQGRKSLAYTLDAEFYCALDVEWEHLNVFYKLLQSRGGVLYMCPEALRTAAILFDVFNSFMHLAPPGIPALFPLTATLTMRNWLQDDIALLLATKLGHGFASVYETLPHCTESVRLQHVLQGFVNTIIDFDHIDRSKSESFKADQPKPKEPSVIWIRSMLIHELLTIPESLSKSDDLKDDLSLLSYEMCRLSCLMFCQVWGFADSNRGRRMARKLVLRLIPMLKRATEGEGMGKLCSELPDFYTWIVVLGLMLAYEDLDAFDDVTCIRDTVPFLAYSVIKPRPEAWPTVSTTMSGFFWLWKDCEITGREAWNYSCHLANKG